MLELRDYQEEAVDALLSSWSDGTGHGLIVLPTGAGKSLVAARLMQRLHQEFGARVLLASHVSELISQNAAALSRLWPDAPYGIYHAGLGRRDGDAPIVLAGIHSIYRAPARTIGRRQVFLVDECHLIPHTADGMYRAVIDYLEAEVPGMRVGGLTATPYRLSTGRLDEDYGKHPALFDRIVYEVTVRNLIDRGFLCPILPYNSPTRLDVSGVKKTGGDYNKKQLEHAVNVDDINVAVVDEIIRAGRDRSTWLLFATGVDHAEQLTRLLRERGVSAACVTGETKEKERQRIFSGARSGDIRALVGMNVMTTGLDVPSIDLIAMVRPTASLGLFIQMLGRGTRLSPETDKRNCILLDFSDNSLNFGPIDAIDGSKSAGDGKGTAPARECPACGFVHHASMAACPQCEHKHPPPATKYNGVSRVGAIMSDDQEPLWYTVDSVAFKRHRKAGSKDSLRIDYVCGLLTVSEWIVLEHETASGMAKKWWENNSWSGEAPLDVTEALERTSDLRIPGRVQVLRQGKYHRIIGRDYSVSPNVVIPIEREVGRAP